MENGRQLYVKVLVGKGYEQKIEDPDRVKLGTKEVQTLKKRDGFGNKDFVLLLENKQW